MAVLYDNSSEANCSVNPVWGDGTGNPGARYISFTPASSFTLSSIQANVFPDSFIGSGVMNFHCSLFADAGATPGAEIVRLATINGSGFSFCGPAVMFDLGTLLATPTVNGGTRYWLGFLTDGDGTSATDSTTIGLATDSLGTGVPGEYHAQFVSGSLGVAANDVSNFPYVVTINGGVVALPGLMKFAGRPAGFPTLVADLRGAVMVLHGLDGTTGADVFQMATTPDVIDFGGWRITKLWNLQLDAGPPPPNLKVATAVAAHFLSRDVTDAARGRAFLSITASDTSVTGAQALYVGLIEWDAVTPA